MDAMATQITGNIIQIAWDIFSTPVKNYVNRLIEGGIEDSPNLDAELERSNGVAAGVAIGYFHNFLKPLDEAISHDRLMVFETKIEESGNQISFTPEQIEALGMEGVKQMSKIKLERHSPLTSYDADHFKFTIVYPSKLNNPNFQRVSKFLRTSTIKGAYYNRPNARPYGINFELYKVEGQTEPKLIKISTKDRDEIDNTELIHLYDYARPVEAIYKFYAEDRNLSDNEILLIEKEEMQLFLATIIRLITKKTYNLCNNLTFMAIA